MASNYKCHARIRPTHTHTHTETEKARENESKIQNLSPSVPSTATKKLKGIERFWNQWKQETMRRSGERATVSFQTPFLFSFLDTSV